MRRFAAAFATASSASAVCPTCGTTLTWTLELCSKQHWVPIPPEIEQFEKSAIQRPLKVD